MPLILFHCLTYANMTISRTGYIVTAVVIVLVMVSGAVWWLRQRSLRTLPTLNQVSDVGTLTDAEKDTAAGVIATTDAVIEKRTFLVPPVQELPPGLNVILADGSVTSTAVSPSTATGTVPVAVIPPADTDGDGLTDDQARQLGT